MFNSRKFTVEITLKTVLQILAALGLIWMMVQVIEVVALVFVSYILYAALSTIVRWIESIKIGPVRVPRVISMLLVTILMISVLGLILWGIIGPSWERSRELAQDFDSLVSDAVDKFELEQRLGSDAFTEVKERVVLEINKFTDKLFNNPQDLLSLGRNVASGFLSVVTLIILTVYQLSSPGKVKNVLVSFVEDKERAMKVMDKVEEKLGYWLRGQLLLMFLMGLITYIGLRIIGINFELPLAILVGLFDIIPIVGPIIAFIPAVIVTLATGEVWQLVALLVFYAVLQQLEGNLLVPKIMESSVGLDPVLVIISLLIGSQWGIVGAILSVPIAAIVVIFYQEWKRNRDAVSQTQKVEEDYAVNWGNGGG